MPTPKELAASTDGYVAAKYHELAAIVQDGNVTRQEAQLFEQYRGEVHRRDLFDVDGDAPSPCM